MELLKEFSPMSQVSFGIHTGLFSGEFFRGDCWGERAIDQLNLKTVLQYKDLHNFDMNDLWSLTTKIHEFRIWIRVYRIYSYIYSFHIDIC